ncbi:MAG: IMP cyclohydrolase [Victivallaceae bacterium]|nr:IMP cyclohydrolase [Victivallaceae bacterium]
MYIGRIVAVGITGKGKAAALYRVSSRSFPNREAVISNGKAAVVPRAGFESDLGRNPYIAYNALRQAGKYTVVTNGSHTDPIAEKIAAGLPPRDALTLSLLALDYEHDSLDTPRIAGVISGDGSEAFLAIVRKDAVLVRRLAPKPGTLFYISTYEHCYPCESFHDDGFTAATAAECCDFIIGGGVFAGFTNPVTAAAAVSGDDGVFTVAVKNA